MRERGGGEFGEVMRYVCVCEGVYGLCTHG